MEIRALGLASALVAVLTLMPACRDVVPSQVDIGSPRPDGSGFQDLMPHDSASRDLGATPDTKPADPAIVPTQYGPVRGSVSAKFRAFLGIPYAGPVSGSARWKLAPPPAPWTQVRDAMHLGPSCPQEKSVFSTLPDLFSEDCLTLNVWTPWPDVSKRAPVMVWIHGGGFIQGGSAMPVYDGAAFAREHGVVLVSFNYRLGPLGFLSLKALGADANNLGLRDQQMALKWVQDNIAAFGGDPKRVTIFGESAGSVSVCAHMASPLSKGLFHRAILESGPCSSALPSLSDAQAQGQRLLVALGCDRAQDPTACLRGTSAKALREALPAKSGVIFGAGVSWGLVVDGVVLSQQPEAAVEGGSWNKVPVLAGTNKDEGTLFVLLAKMSHLTEAQYEAAVNAGFGQDASKVLAQYPVSQYKGSLSWSASAAALSDLLTDVAFVCPTRDTLHAIAGAGLETYAYHFTVTPSTFKLAYLGATHASEIGFVFGNLSSKNSQAERDLSAMMMGYWAEFASGKALDGVGSLLWPKYNSSSDVHMAFGLIPKTASALKKKSCDFWKTIKP